MPFIPVQACRDRQQTWEAAVDLTQELDTLLSISNHLDVLKERGESRKALDKILRLIAEVSDYIRNYTETAAGLPIFRIFISLMHC